MWHNGVVVLFCTLEINAEIFAGGGMWCGNLLPRNTEGRRRVWVWIQGDWPRDDDYWSWVMCTWGLLNYFFQLLCPRKKRFFKKVMLLWIQLCPSPKFLCWSPHPLASQNMAMCGHWSRITGVFIRNGVHGGHVYTQRKPMWGQNEKTTTCKARREASTLLTPWS